MPPPNDELVRKRTSADFVFGKVIGEGSFSTVYLAKDVHTSREFAIKVLEKRHIIREKKTEYVTREKKVLQILGSSCKYFVHLYYTFQDTDRLYFVLTYAKNGELLQQINKDGAFSLECTKYYAAELVLALEYLKLKGIVHRDLKPENVLFDENWHILIIDFGSAKILGEDKSSDEESQKRRKYSFVGTAQYVSPEILNDDESTCASDLWALGCIIYQMLTGQMPFRGPSEYLIFQKILKLDYEFPQGFDKVAKDLIEKFLVIAPSSRLGATDQVPYKSIREHEFFREINWDDLGPPPNFSAKCENSSDIVIIPDDLEPGLDEEKASRLHFRMLQPQTPPRKKSEPNRKITDLSQEEIEQRLEQQKSNNSVYHELVEGNLILKQGIVEKRKGIFPRRRMLLLTLGPHLYYVDPVTMTLKGEIPWSDDLKPEAKNFKKFFVHTPNRIYYLEDPDGYALEWCKAIDEVKAYYYPVQQL
ncbi:3-phosphoinositide-dependent protein kinase 1 [Tribolium castaneum]|uniref:3-phosphoinositide-dependent protein kinase 1 n=1 Tax=Tribolium castaneum TaxID=7070 RepID=D6WGV3_TRICA|nr:PREDICTED: 3-phosphoinositide-dependent protein kinase 1 [Tribolium castaneum]XP_973143.1 PREDICTED: 3-phosphoinositide-dependent protein kinase 1 [Tribolium castaneum]EFA00152.1 3-phosphoinositide-dependent protein kinase 1-like Protein [Tribolium castaneum]|eukprot:XP_015833394.1 PREDICTED: 3-phosphoinositide-dependent protein kinase 1 [Tribolium castaneum]